MEMMLSLKILHWCQKHDGSWNLKLKTSKINLSRWDTFCTHLIGQTMQRTSQAIHGCTEGQVGVRQSTPHQVAGVGTDVASFMVTETL